MNTRRGFIPEPTLPEHYVLGSGQLTARFGATLLMPNGDKWEEYLPEGENQSNESLETFACTIAASLNAWETVANLLKKKGYIEEHHFPRNCSERFNAIVAGIVPPGGSPHKSAEAIRNRGVINEEVLPFSAKIRTWDEYYHPTPMPPEFLKLAKETTKYVHLQQEWLFNDETKVISPLEKRIIIEAALRRGVVCASVYGWKQKNDVYFKDSEKDTHWTEIYKLDSYDRCFDTYVPFKKKIKKHTDYYCAKMYTMSPKTKEEIEEEERKLNGLWSQVRVLLQKFFNTLTLNTYVDTVPLPEPQNAPVEPVPAPKPPVPPTPSNREILYEVSKGCIGKSMVDPSVPIGLGCASALNNVFLKAFGKKIGGGASTSAVLKVLLKDPRFQEVKDPLPGDIVMNASDSSTKGFKNGHTGIRGKTETMSNNSVNGKWSAHYTNGAWVNFFEKERGFKTRYFRVL